MHLRPAATLSDGDRVARDEPSLRPECVKFYGVTCTLVLVLRNVDVYVVFARAGRARWRVPGRHGRGHVGQDPAAHRRALSY